MNISEFFSSEIRLEHALNDEQRSCHPMVRKPPDCKTSPIFANIVKRGVFALVLAVAAQPALAGDLEADFLTPPDAARPGVYWYFMDGNQDRTEMEADLTAMKEAGIGSVVFLEVDLGMPRGPVPFMSEQWQDNVSHAFVVAGQLGMEAILGTGPGWAGSGGSWVRAGDSMKHLVSSSTAVSGPGALNQVLPVPSPHPANGYAGMDAAQEAERNAWYEDVAVLAFPTPSGGAIKIPGDSKLQNAKTLKDVRPITIDAGAPAYVPSQASYTEPPANQAFNKDQVVDLTSLMQPDGRITWTIPPGNWTIMRFAARSTGQTTRPAPRTGHGFENDKFDGETYQRHWDEFQAKLLTKVIAEGGPLQPGRGWTTVHLDSWEMSSQNWTSDFRAEFKNRRGYDPQPYYPTFMASLVGGLEMSERFLWDMRKTSQELVLDEYAGKIKQIAHDNGMLYSNEPYDMNPAGNIDLGSLADIPMCEFWYAPNNTIYSCIEAASISHTMGQQIVRAESFTSRVDAFAQHPANMKNQTDWAFGIGINSIIFHTFQHQPLGSTAKPGMTMGRYGIEWHRNSTLWDFLNPYHEYIARSSHMLQQGEAIADILYLTPEGVPHVFYAPDDATEGPANMPDKKGYSFDAVTPRILGMKATVEDGRIAFPDGSKYRVMVLPDSPTMTPETLAVIEQLVQDGATVIGKPPVKSPSLVNYPACDTEVSTMANTMWGATTPPGTVTPISHGNGTIYWGGGLDPSNGLYPTYAETAALLSSLNLAEDFSSPSGKLRYTHRQNAECDFYFVSNRTSERVETEGRFRISGLQPELWDPLTGETRTLEEFSVAGGDTTIPLTFEPLQSFFIVFPHGTAGTAPPATAVANFDTLHDLGTLAGSWSVSFDAAMGAPANIAFNQLGDWTKRPETGIRYYSGTATYEKNFDLPGIDSALNPKVFLDLGTVHDICRVTLNGQDLGILWSAPWRVDITEAAKPTGNTLKIEVANVWVNRLIGDEQAADARIRTLSWPSGLLGGASYQAGRYTYATWDHFNASSALLPAGLLGPVNILANGSDPSPPTTSMLIPRDNVTTPIVPTKLRITFNEPIRVGTGRIAIRNLENTTDTLIDATDESQISFDGETMVVRPSSGLLASTRYAVRIEPAAVEDLSGNPFPGISDDTTWNFTTGAKTGNPVVADGFAGAFTAGNGATAGRTPDSIAPLNTTYSEQQNSNLKAKLEVDTTIGNPGQSMKTGFNNSAHIQYSSTGTPTLPVTLSIDAQINTIQDESPASGGFPRGIGLGFWNPLPTPYPRSEGVSTVGFTGIVINPSGTLEYVRQGTSQGIFTSAPSGFSASSFRTLRYTVNPQTGDITSLIYGGNDYTAAFQAQFPENFTLSATAGFLGSSANNADYFGRVDNFIVETTPFVVGALQPDTGSMEVAADADLILTFTKPVTAGSGALTVHLPNGVVVQSIDVNSSAVSINHSQVTINLPASLAAGISYYVLVPPGAFLDSEGSAHVGISSPTGWMFTVAKNTTPSVIDDFNDNTLNAEWNLSQVLNAGAGAAVSLNTTSYPDELGYTFTGASSNARQHVLLRDDVTLSQPGDFIQSSVRLVGGDSVQLFFGLAIDQNSITPGNRDALVALFVDGSGAIGILDGSIPAVVATTPAGTVNDANETFLRLTLATADSLQASYSTDGVNFSNLASPVAISGVSAVGYYTGNSRSNDLGSGVADNFSLFTSPDFNQWIGRFGLLPGVQGFNMDADGDQLQNGVEAWFGTAPGRHNPGLTWLAMNGTAITFQHPLSKAPLKNLAGYYEWSPNLVDWYVNGSGPIGGPAVTFVTSIIGAIATVTAMSSDTSGKLFIRVTVSQFL